MQFGIEQINTTTDENGSTLTIIKKYRKGLVVQIYKQRKERFKVYSQKEQLMEYMKHADKVMEKHKAGQLVIKDADPSLYPAFWSEYPKNDIDGSWFVVSQYTEIAEDL